MKIDVKRFFTRHSSEILVGLGIIGYAATTYLSAKAYKECCDRIDARKRELEVDKLDTKEIAKIVWKPCLLPALIFATSTVCVVGAQKKILKKNAALIAAYKTSEATLAEFQKQTKATIGEEAFNKLRETVAEKQIEETPAPERLTVEENGKSYLDDAKELYYDGTYGGYFYATELEIYKAFAETRDDIKWQTNTGLGREFREYVPLSNLYWRLHGEPIGIGDDFGYYCDQYITNSLDYQISNEFKTAPNGKKALVIFYDKAEAISDTF